MIQELPTAYRIAEDEYRNQLYNSENLPFGMESSDPGGFYALEMGPSIAKIMPGPEFNSSLYRGQSAIYRPCKPTLYRGELSLFDFFIKKMRYLQFKENVINLPNVIQFSKGRILHYNMFVDYNGVAQHYGIDTDLLDFSSNPFIAAFFAVTYYDSNEKRYLPIEDDKKTGIFYQYCLRKSGGFHPEKLDVVGVQPFQRPVKQRAFSVKVMKNGCLHEDRNVFFQKFCHNKKASHKIYDMFEGGDALIPNDPVAEMAESVKVQNVFSEEIFLQTIDIFFSKNNIEEMKKMAFEAGIYITNENTNHLFSDKDMSFINSSWEEIKREIDKKLYIRPVLTPIP